MAKPKILIQLDGDPQPSVFDAVVALDAGVDHLLRQAQVRPEDVAALVHGAMFTRGVDDLHRTAVFIGGNHVAAGEALARAVIGSFFGPLRVSVLIDPHGANTTAAAAVLAAAKHLDLTSSRALVLAGTGPVGQRVARLLAGQGGEVRLASRRMESAADAVKAIGARVPGARLSACATSTEDELAAALADVHLVVAAGAAGVELLSATTRRAAAALAVAIDLNAVPPVGLAGVEPTDKARQRDGLIAYGALGVGGTKMKIHRRAVERLFESNDQVLDAEEILALGRAAGW